MKYEIELRKNPSKLTRVIKRFMTKGEEGATAVEYSLLVGLIAVAIIAAVGFLGDEVKTTFDKAKCAVADKTWSASIPNGC